MCYAEMVLSMHVDRATFNYITSSQSKRIRIHLRLPSVPLRQSIRISYICTNLRNELGNVGPSIRVTGIIGLQLTMTSFITSSPYRISEFETSRVIVVVRLQCMHLLRLLINCILSLGLLHNFIRMAAFCLYRVPLNLLRSSLNQDIVNFKIICKKLVFKKTLKGDRP